MSDEIVECTSVEEAQARVDAAVEELYTAHFELFKLDAGEYMRSVFALKRMLDEDVFMFISSVFGSKEVDEPESASD